MKLLLSTVYFKTLRQKEHNTLITRMIEQFEKCLKRVNFYWKLIGMSLDYRGDSKTITHFMRSHKIYLAQFFSLNFENLAQILWVFEAVITGKTFLEITYLIPCLLLCLISIFKTVTMLYYGRYNYEFIVTMKELLMSLTPSNEEDNVMIKNVIDKHVLMLMNISKKIVTVVSVCLLMFALGPVSVILPHYFKTNEVKLELPFIAYYPFNEFDARIYPCLYLHQLWSAIFATVMVYGPDCFFFTCCTFIHIQFTLLSYDIESLVSDGSRLCDRTRLKQLVIRHIELMRCVELVEKIFSKSILFNALSSTIIICVTGFNVSVGDNILMMGSFMAFLIFGLMEIFFYCYYGDIIMRSSMKVGDAIYNSGWYMTGAADRKLFLLVLIRSQKPCELTAYGFFKINLYAFTSILSSSWSYFALLKTMYHPE